MSLSVEIAHRFPAFQLEVAFTAPPGLTCLFGRSGSGKTTIINAVAGLLRPDQARITLDGVALQDLAPHKRRVGYVFQDARLFPHLTVAQNLAYGAKVRRLPLTGFDRIVDLLGIGGLLERRPATLSGGEKSRVAIGRALLSGPQILLMDEPFSALDEARKAEILPYVEALRDQMGLPILYVSHSLPEVARLATTIAVIDAGRLVAFGPAAEVLSDPVTAPLLGLADAGAILTAQIAAHEADGLTRLETGAGPLWLPRLAGAIGGQVRVRIAAQDVILARARPDGLSALNILPCRVSAVQEGRGPGVLVQLDLGGAALLARITRRSAQALEIAPGLAVFAVVKTVAVAQGDVGAERGSPLG
ncbi:molybdenum ABC transporter ATP-binding protein [Tabrizicola piscis]|uniref:Molybdenum ABC transporter ATP-binding protein n=1 Tax=Tabrizicola piscis TaxID=2494374 RepID=A0A3S8U359_9RHOB|nr:molybdenum ABC transporter ATP-binding protein [Tabrizicola piscis]AZL58031.1 molybdenum ABC transporter ATP-binding protein [Tabrizicola piscis]